MIRKPELIDHMLEFWKENQACINNRWYVAKDIQYPSILERLYHAYLILIKKARAFQFQQDRN